mmetsp:Transcript_8705/g.15416  ORF Transcript_8705/g.15416 Transcript_8705/m.15416 type:complete len:445 (+) Transcript_8705:237-1571(+)
MNAPFPFTTRSHPIWFPRQPRAMLLIAAIMNVTLTFWFLVIVFDGEYSVCWAQAAMFALQPIMTGLYVYRGSYALVRTRRGPRTWFNLGKGLWRVLGGIWLFVFAASYCIGLLKEREYYAFTRVKGDGACFPPNSTTVKILIGYAVFHNFVSWPLYYLVLRHVDRDELLISRELGRFYGSVILLHAFQVAVMRIKQKTKTDIELAAYAWVFCEILWLHNSFMAPKGLTGRVRTRYVRVLPTLAPPAMQQEEADVVVGTTPQQPEHPLQTARVMCKDNVSLKRALSDEESYSFLLNTASSYYMEENVMFLYQVQKYLDKYSSTRSKATTEEKHSGMLLPLSNERQINQDGMLAELSYDNEERQISQDGMFDELCTIIQDFILPNSPYEFNLEADFLARIQDFQNKGHFIASGMKAPSSQVHIGLLKEAFHKVARLMKENLDLFSF